MQEVAELFHGARDGLWSLDPFSIEPALRSCLTAYGSGYNRRDREELEKKHR